MPHISKTDDEHTIAVLRERLAEAERRLDERQVIDRAKGLLMTAGLSEDDAYRHLRQQAMRRQMRLGDLARELLRNV